MRVLFMTTLIGALGVCAVAAAQPASHDSAVLCLDGLGVSHPATCHSSTASRISPEPDICTCNGPYQEVKTSWCARNEQPPNDSADFDRARVAAVHNGSLVGFTYQGRRACVPLGPNG
ncbi:MAG TPA: hypothetical protein VIJ94_07605 [Caulobacteraceae bacterium]